MIQPFQSKFLTPTKKFRRLSILLAIRNDPRISQHKVARVTHLSSSMVNNYMKELQQEGLITVTGNTNRTQEYHLTSSGRDELISALLSYSAEIIQLYGAAKRELTRGLRNMHLEEGIRTVALFGAAETAEVVYAAIKETPLAVTAIVDSDRTKQGKRFNGLTIQAPEQLIGINAEAVVITSFARQEEIQECIHQLMGKQIKVIRLSDL
ncbi:MAG: winged helix-turn-helix transcriptional regulator [Deltaproteobacteria bacterium]|nr:winged helix-turn-helix transcriptional regulator [Deltaproteobacteria bacterium]RLB83488.1 MAG: transcriptional regulator [Deltaproteobacteria bacterium]